MISDIRAGRLVDDTMERHFEYLRHLKGRREIIVNEIQKANSRHRGPGTPGYRDLDGERPLPPASRAPDARRLAKAYGPPEGEGLETGGASACATQKGAGSGVDH